MTEDIAEKNVNGTIIPDQVLAVTGQGIIAGRFDASICAIRAGAAYAKIHWMMFFPG